MDNENRLGEEFLAVLRFQIIFPLLILRVFVFFPGILLEVLVLGQIIHRIILLVFMLKIRHAISPPF